MSMHKTPLTTIEETGLIAHGFGRDIGRPSMAADIFRIGVAWAQMSTADQITNIQKQLEHGMPFDKDLNRRLTSLLTEMVAAQVPDHVSDTKKMVDAQPTQDPIAWQATKLGLVKFVTQSKYDHYPNVVKKWYQPFKCASCSSQAQEPAIRPPTKDYICGKCGYECNLVRKELDTFKSEDMQSGRLLERKYIVADVTSCCQYQEFYHKDDPDDAEPKSRQHGEEVHWIAPGAQEEAPFIPWNGGACPVSPHDIVEYTLRGSPDVVNESVAMFIEFKYGRDRLPSDCEIISYRVKKLAHGGGA